MSFKNGSSKKNQNFLIFARDDTNSKRNSSTWLVYNVLHGFMHPTILIFEGQSDSSDVEENKKNDTRHPNDPEVPAENKFLAAQIDESSFKKRIAKKTRDFNNIDSTDFREHQSLIESSDETHFEIEDMNNILNPNEITNYCLPTESKGSANSFVDEILEENLRKNIDAIKGSDCNNLSLKINLPIFQEDQSLFESSDETYSKLEELDHQKQNSYHSSEDMFAGID